MLRHRGDDLEQPRAGRQGSDCCDLNAFICNYYRAVRGDYEATSYWSDWPTNHHDLTARHRWLLAQGPELSERMVADPDDFDAKIAGWWCWGQSSWIGHGWCDS